MPFQCGANSTEPSSMEGAEGAAGGAGGDGDGAASGAGEGAYSGAGDVAGAGVDTAAGAGLGASFACVAGLCAWRRAVGRGWAEFLSLSERKPPRPWRRRAELVASGATEPPRRDPWADFECL
jgi:hypothetical protein